MKIEIVTARLAPEGGVIEVPWDHEQKRTLERVDPVLFQWDGAPHVALVVTSSAAARAQMRTDAWRDRLRAAEQPLFDALRAWRRDRALEDAVAPFLVLTNRTLAEIAATRPRDADELACVHGIGPKKHAAYAEAVIDLVERFEAEVELE